MRLVLVAIGFTTACASEASPPSCSLEATVDSSGVFGNLGPLDLGATDICLHVDASSAHFPRISAQSDVVDGTSTPWRLRLTDPDGKVLASGRDDQLLTDRPQARAVVDYQLDAPMQIDVVLRAAAKDGHAVTALHVAVIGAQF